MFRPKPNSEPNDEVIAPQRRRHEKPLLEIKRQKFVKNRVIRGMKLAIINGPNLNLLGKRETDIYGNMPFDKFFMELKRKFPFIEWSYFQSNVEGELINELQRVGFDYDGIIFNPGGYT